MHLPGHHHHHGIISEIEDEIVQLEQMALSGGGAGASTAAGARAQPGGVMQDPGIAPQYGQDMYGAYGASPYGQPPQSNYGTGAYAAGGGGTVFGGANEGAPAAYQQSSLPPQGYGPGRPPQGYPPQGPQYPPQNQQYPPTNQQYPPRYQQYPPQNQQYPLQNQSYPPQGQQHPPQGAYAGPSPPPQGYGAPGAAPAYGQRPPPGQYPNQGPYPAQGPAQGSQYPPQGSPVGSSYLNPASQAPGAQSNQSSVNGYPAQPAGPPGMGSGPQYAQPQIPGQTQAQLPAQYGQAPPPMSQMPPDSQYSAQTQYTAQNMPPSPYGSGQGPDALRGQGSSGIGMGGLAAGAAVAGAAALAYGAYQHHESTAAIVEVPVPTHLSPAEIDVPFEPLHGEMKHMSHHHALKLLSNAHHSVPKMSQIIGTYLMAKQADGSAAYGTPASRPEVKLYYHEMDKLEKLSQDFLHHHESKEREWKEALAPHRRYVFGQLFNRNELVRAFCTEMKGGVLALPHLDAYALGEKISMSHFTKTAVRQANKGAALSLLARVRSVLLVDDSYSMTERGHESWGFGTHETRWQQTRCVIAGITPLIAGHNTHGIDLHFLNRTPFYAGLKTEAAAEAAFDKDQPNNGTPTGARVNDILDAYACVLRYYRALLPLNLIVITDGEANDEELLHQAIEHHVTELVHRGFPAHQFGIEFVQVGDCRWATAHLEKLEKEVSRHHHKFQRDVVGVTPATRINRMDAEELLAIACSGIDARLNQYMRSHGVNV